MVKKNQVARGVRVRLNSNWVEKCMGDQWLQEEPVIFIFEGHTYNDNKGEYVNIKGGSLLNSGYAYLDQIDLEFPVPEEPMYHGLDTMVENEVALLLQERDNIEARLSEIDPNLLMNYELNRYSKALKDIGFDKDKKKFKD